MLTKPSTTNILLFVVAALLVLGGISALLWARFAPEKQPPTFCTMEAKQCPDGSYVGRIPPSCEFAQCPSVDLLSTDTLPQGYTLDSYKVEKVLETSCMKDAECETPPEYLIQSRCPFVSLCLQNKCTVVCPEYVENGWQTATDTAMGVTFQYPEKLGTKYIDTVDWPPKIQLLKKPFTCTLGGNEIQQAGQTTEQSINGRTYCITKESEGAAGSTYTQYAYAFAKDYPTNTPDATKAGSETVVFTFTLRFPQCANYDDPKKTECEKERTAFTIDPIVDTMARTIKMYGSFSSVSLKEQLQDCMPKSDTASHDTCIKLLKQIQSYSDCITAGFPILKSNPPQCKTPDGRSFTNAGNTEPQDEPQIYREFSL